MTLGTSDWVTIIATAVSLASSAAIAIGVAVWQVRRMSGSPKATSQGPVFMPSARKWLLAQLWPFFASGLVALLIISQTLYTEGPVTRSFVISLVFGGFLFAFSVLSSIGFIVASAFRPAYLLLQNRTIRPFEPSSVSDEVKL